MASESGGLLERLLIPLDGSAGGERVLPLIPWLARSGAREVAFVRVVDADEREPADFERALLKLAQVYLRRIEGDLPSASAVLKSIARTGPVVETILSVAREEASSLVLLSTRGDRRSGRPSLGASLLRLIEESPIPLLLVNPLIPFGTERALRLLREKGDRRVMVAADLHDPPDGVVSVSSRLAGALSLRMLLLQVAAPAETGGGEADARAEAEDRLARWRRRFERQGRVLEGIVDTGDPERTIVLAAQRAGAGVLVIDRSLGLRRGESGLSAMVKGILLESRIPVLLPGRSDSGRER